MKIRSVYGGNTPEGFRFFPLTNWETTTNESPGGSVRCTRYRGAWRYREHPWKGESGSGLAPVTGVFHQMSKIDNASDWTTCLRSAAGFRFGDCGSNVYRYWVENQHENLNRSNRISESENGNMTVLAKSDGIGLGIRVAIPCTVLLLYEVDRYHPYNDFRNREEGDHTRLHTRIFMSTCSTHPLGIRACFLSRPHAHPLTRPLQVT